MSPPAPGYPDYPAMPDADTPRRTPRRDTREQWTLKHRDLTPELRALVAKAAEMQGMPVGQWVAHVLRERGQAVVRGDGEARSGVPVVPPQANRRSGTAGNGARGGGAGARQQAADVVALGLTQAANHPRVVQAATPSVVGRDPRRWPYRLRLRSCRYQSSSPDRSAAG